MSLYSRGFLSPSFISRLLMMTVLPAKTVSSPKEKSEYDDFESLDKKTLFFFNGNLQPASGNFLMSKSILDKKNKRLNLFAANYPGAFGLPGTSDCVDDLFEAGYQNVRNYMHKHNIAAENITLVGHSLGGGVAAHVALRLHQAGFPVELKIHKSFSSISAVVEDLINQQILDTIFNQFFKKSCPREYKPMINGLLFCGFGLASLGVLITGYLASLGVLFKAIETTLGVYPLISNGFYYSEFIIGGSLTVISLLIGLILGSVLGALLSTQLLFTDKPSLIPTRYAIGALLTAACCEMNSIAQIKQLICLNSQAKIKIYNSTTDEVIPMKASLYHSLPDDLKKTCGEVVTGTHNDNQQSYPRMLLS